jgi:hypothetical protein
VYNISKEIQVRQIGGWMMDTIRLSIENKFEADIFTNILDEENISYDLIETHSLAYDGIFEMTMGWGYVEIPQEFKEKAEELYKEFKESLEHEIIKE